MNNDIDVNRLVTSLSKRVPWSVMWGMLKRLKATTSSGWEPFLLKVQAQSVSTKLSNNEKVELARLPQLKKNLIEHINFCEKSINFFSTKKVQHDLFYQKLKNLKIDDCELSKAFPFQLSKELLKKVTKSVPNLVHVTQYDDGTALTICTKRTLRAKEKLTRDSLSENVRDDYSKSDEIFVIKNSNELFYDVIFICKHKPIIEIMLDHKYGMFSEIKQEAYHQTLAQFRVFTKKLGISLELKGVDLFDFIKPLYDDPSNAVVEMAFSTDDGFTDRIKQRKEGSDIRNADYHIGGTEKLNGNWDPYWIAKQYNIPALEYSVNPELILPGQLRMLSLSNEIRLRGALLLKCSGKEDSQEILSDFRDWINDETSDETNAA
jgi:hypothetical protein